MPTQRPFFANFLAAFRAHSSPSFNAKSSPGSSGSTSPSSGVTGGTHLTSPTSSGSPHPSNAASNPRAISTKATAFQTSQAQTAISSPPEINSTSTGAAAPSSLPRSPNTTSHYVNMSMSSPVATSRGRQRRGSDDSSSSGGFKDILGPEKWYIGGRTATGEEKFYRLGLVTTPGGGIGGSGQRVRSLDRLSL